jgi:hypothetical protein
MRTFILMLVVLLTGSPVFADQIDTSGDARLVKDFIRKTSERQAISLDPKAGVGFVIRPQTDGVTVTALRTSVRIPVSVVRKIRNDHETCDVIVTARLKDNALEIAHASYEGCAFEGRTIASEDALFLVRLALAKARERIQKLPDMSF